MTPLDFAQRSMLQKDLEAMAHEEQSQQYRLCSLISSAMIRRRLALEQLDAVSGVMGVPTLFTSLNAQSPHGNPNNFSNFHFATPAEVFRHRNHPLSSSSSSSTMTVSSCSFPAELLGPSKRKPDGIYTKTTMAPRLTRRRDESSTHTGGISEDTERLDRSFPPDTVPSSTVVPANAAGDAASSTVTGAAGSKKTSKWLAMLEELKLYKEKYGDCIVPRGYSDNPRLASWVAEQRKQYKLLQSGQPSSIIPERISLLNECGFVWNAQEAAWNRQIEDLRQFRRENGHCIVPLNHKKYPKLGLWVKEQRRHYARMKEGKQSHMNEERINALEELRFCWDTHQATWTERLRELAEFKERYGTCMVPTGFEDNPRLGTWVHHQRRQYKKFMQGRTDCHITHERIKALEELGFVWHPRERGSAMRSSMGSMSDGSSICSLESSSSKTRISHQEQQDVDLCPPRKRQRSV